jgi:aspartate kinase
MRVFDRGYSEVTFSKVAVDIKAHEAVIHKEYHLSSADPNIVGIENCVPVGLTNYIIADQLADIGMEAIHPKAAKPLELSGINIRIKNTFEPDHIGTLISKNYVSPDARVEIVSGSKKMLAIEIHDPLMVSEVGYDAKIMDYFQKYNISYVLKSTNANSITMVVWESKTAEKLLEELKQNFYQVTGVPVALVCAMGTNIATPGFLYRAAKALYENDINIECYAQSIMQVNMQFVVKREHYEKAIVALNKALCN